MFLLQDLKATGTERAATNSISQASEWTTVPDENKERSLSLKHNMCMSIYLYNPAILTPVYNEQFRLSKRKAHFFSVNLTCLIRTRVNTVNEDFSVSRVTDSRTSPTLLHEHGVSAQFHDICHFCTLFN